MQSRNRNQTNPKGAIRVSCYNLDKTELMMTLHINRKQIIWGIFCPEAVIKPIPEKMHKSKVEKAYTHFSHANNPQISQENSETRNGVD